MVVFNGNNTIHVGNRYSSAEVVGSQVYAMQFGGSSTAGGNVVSACDFLGFAWGTPFNFYNSDGLNVIQATGYCASGGSTSFAGTPHSSDSIDYVQGGTAINYKKTQAYGSFADDTAAAAGGVPSGGAYRNSTTGALTIKA